MALLLRIIILSSITFILMSFISDELSNNSTFEIRSVLTSENNGTYVYSQSDLSGVPVDTLKTGIPLRVRSYNGESYQLVNGSGYVAKSKTRTEILDLGDLFFIVYIVLHVVASLILIYEALTRREKVYKVVTTTIFTPIPVLVLLYRALKSMLVGLLKALNKSFKREQRSDVVRAY